MNNSKPTGRMSRHDIREAAFILTFERSFENDTIEDIIETSKECEDFDINEEVVATALDIEKNKQEIDENIKKHLKNWDINRISKVSLAVLRVAVYELLYRENLDTDIIISEAVKLSQAYSYKDDTAFVNGLLASLSKSVGPRKNKQ